MALLDKLKTAARDKKAVFLDLDNTLYAYDPCHDFALRQAHRAFEKEFGEISFTAFYRLYREARDIIHRRFHGQAFSHSRLYYFQIMAAKMAGKSGLKAAVRLEKAYWDAFFRKMKLAAWVKPFLAFCKKAGKTIGIITNLTTQLQIRKLDYLGIEKQIDFLVTSEEAGTEKPDPKIFQLAFRKAGGIKPWDVLSVGDDPATDRFPSFVFVRV